MIRRSSSGSVSTRPTTLSTRPASRLRPRLPAGQSSTPVMRNGETVAVIMHDVALDTDPELVAAAGQALLLAIENGRLTAELESTSSGAPRSACTHPDLGRRPAPQDRARPP